MEPIFEKKHKLNTNQNITSLNEKENITSLINDLYISLKPDCPKNYILPNNFENLIIRILSTNFNVMKNNENIIMNSLLEKVFKISRNNRETINRFQNLYDKLTKRRTLTKRWGILYILNNFSKNNFKDLSFSATNELQKMV